MHIKAGLLWAALAFGSFLPAGSGAASAQEQRAPDFVGIDQWLNSAPLSMAGLRGKVVLVDFWAFRCINCIRTLPSIKRLYGSYAGRGFVVVGVHTPELAEEHSTTGLQAAVRRFGITYPVAQDNESATWNAFANQYWPAQYIIDRGGRIVFTHVGEGDYELIDRKIRSLLDAGR